MTTIPHSLYKYVDPKRVDILANNHVCFSRPSALNDPFEMRPYFDEVIELNEAIRSVSQERREETLRAIYDASETNNVRLLLDLFATVDEWLEFDKDRPQLGDRLLAEYTPVAIEQQLADMVLTRARQFELLDSESGVLRLTEMPDNLLMWAHYASNHEGFVIEFDVNHPMFLDATSVPPGYGHLGKVAYSVNRPLSKYLSDIPLDAMFFHKSKEWEYEQEWRMLRKLPGAANVLPSGAHLFDLPPSCIKSLIFGCRMSALTQQSIEDILTAATALSHVTIRKAEIEEKVFKLRFEPISLP